MRNVILFLAVFIVSGGISFGFFNNNTKVEENNERAPMTQSNYWFMLHRKSNIEYLYRGTPGNVSKSRLIKSFKVKTGRPGERPTPLPKLVGREYWLIIEKHEEKNNPETAPYFMTLDIPAPSVEPYGPEPYLECGGKPSFAKASADKQCDWILPGDFGLHGVNGDISRLSEDDPGSSGCIRHRDQDITYLYNLIDLSENEIRYYIEDV